MELINHEQQPTFKEIAGIIRSALRKRVLNSIPPSPNEERDIAVVRKWLNPNNTLSSIARRHKIPQTSASLIVKRAAVRALRAEGRLPEQTKQPFTLPRRPLGEKLRYKASRTGGGRLQEIADAARNSPDAETLMREANLKPRELSRYRTLLAEIGITVPYINEPVDTSAKRQVLANPEHYKGSLTEFLHGLTIHQYKEFKDEGLVTPMFNALRNLGFACPSSSAALFVSAFKELKFPYGQVAGEVRNGAQAGNKTYSFIVTNHIPFIEPSLEKSKTAKKLFEGKISQVAGVAEPLPVKRGVLTNPNFYSVVTPLLEFLGDYSQEQTQTILSDPEFPVPVFGYNQNYYTAREKAARLVLFIFRKVQEVKGRNSTS